MMRLPRASTSPSGEMRTSTPIAGAPARLSLAARSPGDRSSNSARLRFIVSSGVVSVSP